MFTEKLALKPPPSRGTFPRVVLLKGAAIATNALCGKGKALPPFPKNFELIDKKTGK